MRLSTVNVNDKKVAKSKTLVVDKNTVEKPVVVEKRIRCKKGRKKRSQKY